MEEIDNETKDFVEEAKIFHSKFPDIPEQTCIDIMKSYNGDVDLAITVFSSNQKQKFQEFERKRKPVKAVRRKEGFKKDDFIEKIPLTTEKIDKFEQIDESIFNQLQYINELEKTKENTIVKYLEELLKQRSSLGFSKDVQSLVNLYYESKHETFQIKETINSKILKEMDELIVKLKSSEIQVKNSLEFDHLNFIIEERNHLRQQCFDKLKELCPNLEKMIKDAENKEIKKEAFEKVEKFIKPEEVKDPKKVMNDYKLFISQLDQNVMKYVQNTNQLYENFKRSMNQELKILNDFVKQGEVISNQVLNIIKKDFNEKEEMNQNKKVIEDLSLHYIQILNSLNENIHHKNISQEILKNLPILKSNQREEKRNLLKLKYRKDELELDGASKDLILNIQIEIDKIQSRISNLNESIEKYEKLLFEITEKSYPELKKQSLTEELLPIKIIDSKYQVIRSIKDYELIETIRDNVFIVKYSSKLHILKRFLLNEEKSRKYFLKEINALSKLNHPCIIKIECFFIEEKNIYVQMEYHKDGNLKDCLSKNKIPSFDLRSIFHLLAQAIKHIHDRGIIHCDIKPENIVLNITENSMKPILIDFDISRDLQQSLTKTLKDIRGTNGYIAPEIFNGSMPSTSSDIWSFGCVLFKSFFPNQDPILLPSNQTVLIPSTDNSDLKDLLLSCLNRDPLLRLTIDEIVTHSFFNKSIEKELKKSGQLISSELKIESFRRFLHYFKRGFKNRILEIIIRRENIVSDVINAFLDLEEINLKKKLEITFKGEEGIDVGGLTTNMYTEFFKQIVDPKYGIFECSDNNEKILYLPKSSYKDIKVLKTIGKIMIKCIYDQRVIPEIFPPCLFKYFLDIKVIFRDLEIYDKQMSHSLNQIMLTSIDDYGFNFEEFNEKSRDVTNENKQEYKDKKLEFYLVTKRKEQLEAMKQGFHSIRDLSLQLQLFSSQEFILILFGQELIDPKRIIELLQFEGFNESQTPNDLISILQEFSNLNLRMFLEFITGQCGLKENEKRRILIYKSNNRNSLPISHVCGWQLDLPDYQNRDLLKTKLLISLENRETGFLFA